jgi:hypothetical protein
MLPKRRNSTKIFSIATGWSVSEEGSPVVDNLTEPDAWKTFLATINPAKLLHGGKVMADRK